MAAEPRAVEADTRYVLSLAEVAELDERWIGGKAANLARLAQSGVRVADGFCITSAAYERYVQASGLTRIIQSELGRKPLDQMRWEEIWDAALRLRAVFINTPIPAPVVRAIGDALRGLGFRRAVAVRSSAPGEDSAQRSFAGLHESYLDVVGEQAVLDAVRLVWASLWSDAALLYRRELNLDPRQSRMAVLVQAMVDERPSGVAFGRDPRDDRRDAAIVEAVPGPCSDLVDGLVEPDRWVLERSSGEVLEWRPGEREAGGLEPPLLGARDLRALHGALLRLESFFGWPPDIEWTGRGERWTLLQARPVTTSQPENAREGTSLGEEEDKRPWYLSLRPSRQRLRALRERVAGERIPKLADQGQRLAEQAIEAYDDARLARAIDERRDALETWRKIYWDEFIPFAHGVRQLAHYYNDAVRPADPYEFVGLLQGDRLLAAQRNRALQDLADQLLDHVAIWDEVRAIARAGPAQAAALDAERALERIRDLPGGAAFLATWTRLQESLLDVAYDEQRLSSRPDLLFSTLDQLAQSRQDASAPQTPRLKSGRPSVRALEQRLLAAVGTARRTEAEEVLATARVSWRLRDDDNLLLGRIESQLLRAVRVGVERLRAAGRLAHEAPSGTSEGGEAAAPVVSRALRDPTEAPIELPSQAEAPQEAQASGHGESPRQLVGQPASPGMATGRARRVQGVEDLGRFKAGEVLVCDAIQPTMTQLVPLACAVVERRGGMLIHGAIIARELGIPCVNGIHRATEVLADGELLTVDGYLGIVTVGAPEFDLEKTRRGETPRRLF